MQNALIITAIGMGLVFISIIILWWLMELLVRFAADKKAPEVLVEQPALLSPSEKPDSANKQKIAAVAVAAALQIRKQQAAELAVKMAMQQRTTPQPSGQVQTSSWQAVRRAGQFETRNNLFLRKPRGNKK